MFVVFKDARDSKRFLHVNPNLVSYVAEVPNEKNCLLGTGSAVLFVACSAPQAIETLERARNG